MCIYIYTPSDKYYNTILRGVFQMMTLSFLLFGFGVALGWLLPKPEWFDNLMVKLRAWLNKDLSQ
jgi:uncharacterized membrane protein YciS (DUF1049 family)